jgi:hypothetical protein
MLTLLLPDLKQATSQLFIKESFDYFLVHEVQITTFNTFTIDGRIHPDFYNPDELSNLRDQTLSDWKTIRPICFSLIKGQKLPLRFHLIFTLSESNIDKFIAEYHLDAFKDAIQGLYLNFHYEHGQLQLHTTTSLSVFSMDRSVETAWDDITRRLLKQLQISSMEI